MLFWVWNLLLIYDFDMMMKSSVSQVVDANMKDLDATFWLYFQWLLCWWFFQINNNVDSMFQW